MGANEASFIRRGPHIPQVPVPKQQIEIRDGNGPAFLPLLLIKGSNRLGDMTRFYFHVRDKSDDISRDTEGQDLPDLAAARREAINTSREMLGERLLHGGSLNNRRIEISDDTGDVLAVVDVRDTLFQDDQLRSFSDDVTQSAPTAALNSKGVKPPAR